MRSINRKHSRAELKAAFKRGNVIGENHFNAFIDTSLNSKDDGIEKIAGEPLRMTLQGDGQTNPQQHMLSLYQDPQTLAWQLGLNPWVVDSDTASYSAGFSIASSNRSQLFIANASGNIGIDTVQPQAKLHIANTKGKDALRLNDVFFIVKGDGKVGIGTDVPTNRLDVQGQAAIGQNYSHHAAPTDGLLIEGHVSIGTDDSLNKLTIGQSVNIGQHYASANLSVRNGLLLEGDMAIGHSVAKAQLFIQHSHASEDMIRIDDQVADSTPFIIKADGKVGIATASPQAELHIVGTTNILAIQADTLASQACAISSEAMTVSDNHLLLSGPLAIGTVDTSSELTVVGTVNASETLAATTLTISQLAHIHRQITIAGAAVGSDALQVNGSVRLASGDAMEHIRNTSDLSGEVASDQSLPTQKSVKSYLDTQVSSKRGLNGALTQDFTTGNLRANGTLTIANTLNATFYCDGDQGNCFMPIQLVDMFADVARLIGFVPNDLLQQLAAVTGRIRQSVARDLVAERTILPDAAATAAYDKKLHLFYGQFDNELAAAKMELLTLIKTRTTVLRDRLNHIKAQLPLERSFQELANVFMETSDAFNDDKDFCE
ncbi:MAG: hypothetical protein JKY13_00360 [Gammaproteobacteria bacterium]|nr:hypothetical protein [Gammaproteobacteria bacterium]